MKSFTTNLSRGIKPAAAALAIVGLLLLTAACGRREQEEEQPEETEEDGGLDLASVGLVEAGAGATGIWRG